MSPRGRRPTPTAKKRLAGNPGKRRLNPSEPKPRTAFPRLPRSLLDARAKCEWYRIKEEARRLGLVTPLDAGILAGYCELWSRWSVAQESLHKTALLVKNIRGEIVPNPLVGIEVRLLREMRAYMVELGLTPSARSRIQLAPTDQEEDPFAEYLEESQVMERLESNG